MTSFTEFSIVYLRAVEGSSSDKEDAEDVEENEVDFDAAASTEVLELSSLQHDPHSISQVTDDGGTTPLPPSLVKTADRSVIIARGEVEADDEPSNSVDDRKNVLTVVWDR